MGCRSPRLGRGRLQRDWRRRCFCRGVWGLAHMPWRAAHERGHEQRRGALGGVQRWVRSWRSWRCASTVSNRLRGDGGDPPKLPRGRRSRAGVSPVAAQSCVVRVLTHQVLMVAAFQDPSGVHYQNFVDAFQAHQLVGDEQQALSPRLDSVEPGDASAVLVATHGSLLRWFYFSFTLSSIAQCL